MVWWILGASHWTYQNDFGKDSGKKIRDHGNPADDRDRN